MQKVHDFKVNLGGCKKSLIKLADFIIQQKVNEYWWERNFSIITITTYSKLTKSSCMIKVYIFPYNTRDVLLVKIHDFNHL